MGHIWLFCNSTVSVALPAVSSTKINKPFWGSTRSTERNSYGNVAGWAGGWLAGCPSQPVMYQND